MTGRRVGKEKAKHLAENTEYLNCGICLNRVVKPKFVNCEHSFCEDCLIEHTPAEATKVVCPKCGTETPFPDPEIGLTSIPTNPYVQEILHEYTQHIRFLSEIDPGIQKCEACDSGDSAVACCLVCEEYLCNDCEESHKKLTPMRGHNIEQLDWVPHLEIKTRTPECTTHDGRPAIFSCSCCNKRICIECVGIDYKPEEVENCKKCHRKIEFVKQANLDSKLAVASGGRQHEYVEDDGGVPPDPIQSAVTDSDLRKITCDVDLDDLKEGLVERAQEEITRVECEEKELLAEISAFENRELMTIRRYKDKQRVRALKCKQILSITHGLMTINCPSLVVTVHPRLMPLLDKCSDMNGGSFEEELDVLTFTPDEMRLADTSKLIGRVDCLMTFQSQWGRDGKPGKEQFDWGHGIAVYPSGDIAVCDREAKRIIIYSRAGEVQFEVISPPEKSKHCVNTPCDVAITSDAFLLMVDGSKLVKIFDDKGFFLRAFNTQGPHETPDASVSLCGVAVDDKDRIAVADCGRCAITLHYSDGTLIKQIRCKCHPGFIAINSSYQILISAYPLGKVEVMDYDGNLLFWFNVMIEGRRHKIGGIIVDTQDNMWIGVYDHLEPQQDEKAGSVHVYTPEGLYLGCVARRLHKPVGIAFTKEGDLAVVDYHRIRIFD
ncbi:E3 ubiquitin-protein ligase TRIM71-like [Amphiura filiformis]|uniref:E3 ubiquitin-protein ligase TRIM71-like n=1 Tax=Amphiura filiformis TaxID=82378 RepID=UPI003B220530